MGKIVYIFLNSGSFDDELLQACSQHSYLLEPVGSQELLLDLSSFKRIGDILDALAVTLAGLAAGRASIGLASSPLLARLAVHRRTYPGPARSTCRFFARGDIDIIQVIPGQEVIFISTLPLPEFSPLSARECRLLNRLGYAWVGDLAGLGPYRLQQLLKRDVSQLWQNIQGRDYTPVRALYPPERLGYAFSWEEGSRGPGQLLEFIRAGAGELSSRLERRRVGCHLVEIQLDLSGGTAVSRQRRVSPACHDRKRLAMVLEGLLPDLDKPVEGARIFLGDLKPLEMRAQDLFTLRYTYQQEAREQKRSAILEQLLQRFPGRLGMGMEADRREQVLLFWDPWRFSPGG
ncbi:MAG: hypothetical protein ABRQ24_00640 [Syntrophomonadaceae bacterium]